MPKLSKSQLASCAGMPKLSNSLLASRSDLPKVNKLLLANKVESLSQVSELRATLAATLCKVLK